MGRWTAERFYGIEIVSDFVDAKALKHKFTIHIKNQGLSSTSDSVTPVGLKNDSRGRFKVLVEWTADNKTYKRLCEFMVPALASGAEYKHYCGSQTFQKGELRRYRAKVDYLDWINERKEDNNNLVYQRYCHRLQLPKLRICIV